MTRERFRRLLKLMALLPPQPVLNLGALAGDLGCDERTVKRNVDVLVEAGIARYRGGCAWLAEDQLGFVERLVNLRPQSIRAVQQ